MPSRNTTSATKVSGYSVLEVVVATSLMAFALVPALSILRDGMKWSREIDTRELLLTFAVNKLEEQTNLVAAAWTPTTLNGDFSADGHADLRYTVFRSDNPTDGGIVSRLMFIRVTTYDDLDGDDSLDASEPSLSLTTKIGKFATYEAESGS